MSDKTRYTNEPIGKIDVIADFLPSPAELAFREEGVKVTLALSKKSVDFFKLQAARHHTQYQRMIRRLVDNYVDAHAGEKEQTRRSSPRRARL
jgi:predicted DNA binding CopG/RHH family protein